MKKLLFGILGILVVLIIVAALSAYFYQKVEKSPDTRDTSAISDPYNTLYIVEGETFTLVEGSAEKDIAPGSATKSTVSVFGKPSYGDIDDDGDEDAVVLLVNDQGGSGDFFYAALAVNVDGDYKGTDAILLGDRIAPQTFYIEGNRAIVNYMIRKPGEDFSVRPSVGKSLYLQFDPESYRLILIDGDFAGEADPNVMTLDMHTWTWIKTTYHNDTELVPNNPDAFTLTFNNDGTVSATTDCNAMSGTYTVSETANQKSITFGNLASTKMFCQDSQEQDFAAMLRDAQSYFFTAKGELVFELKLDTGSAIFR